MRLINTSIIIYFLVMINFSLLANENKILLKVNNELITSIDILNEINYLTSVNQNIDNLEKNKVFEIARNSLIKDKIRKIALLSIVEKIEITDDDFERVLISNYSNTGLKTIKEISDHINRYNISDELIREKMTINAIWNQFIYDKYSKNIKINIPELKEEILKNENQIEYLLSEIVFNLDKGQSLNEKFISIKKAIDQNGFENSALEYSISETSTSGGNIGWVSENSINKNILKKISKIDINNYTEPITIPGGFLIIKLNNKRITKREIEMDDELKKIVKVKTNEQLNQFSNIFLNKIKKDVIINEF